MKRLFLVPIVLLFLCAVISSCSESKTYAELLSQEHDAIAAYVTANSIQTISLDEFLKDTVTDVSKNQYVELADGVLLQIVQRYDTAAYASFNEAPAFANKNVVIVRYVEVNIQSNDTTEASNVCNPTDYLNTYPDGFLYTNSGSSVYGQFLNSSGLAYFKGYGMAGKYGSTSVPSGWLEVLQYIHDGAHVKLIVPSKSGHVGAQQYVIPYFYDIRKFSIS